MFKIDNRTSSKAAWTARLPRGVFRAGQVFAFPIWKSSTDEFSRSRQGKRRAFEKSFFLRISEKNFTLRFSTFYLFKSVNFNNVVSFRHFNVSRLSRAELRLEYQVFWKKLLLFVNFLHFQIYSEVSRVNSVFFLFPISLDFTAGTIRRHIWHLISEIRNGKISRPIRRTRNVEHSTDVALRRIIFSSAI